MKIGRGMDECIVNLNGEKNLGYQKQGANFNLLEDVGESSIMVEQNFYVL